MNSFWLVLGASIVLGGCSASAERDDAATEDETRPDTPTTNGVDPAAEVSPPPAQAVGPSVGYRATVIIRASVCCAVRSTTR